MIGPFYPVLEWQARWIAYTFIGAQAPPWREEAEAGIAGYQARRGLPQALTLHVASLLFSRAAKVEPELERFPELARALLFGPLTPMSFRMTGRDSLHHAPERFAAEILEFGCMPTNKFDPGQAAQLQALANARRDEAFSRYVATALGEPRRVAGPVSA